MKNEDQPFELKCNHNVFAYVCNLGKPRLALVCVQNEFERLAWEAYGNSDRESAEKYVAAAKALRGLLYPSFRKHCGWQTCVLN